ncbi:MAG TPA: RodZ domain-containing protein [Thermoanaerobaculia bacterium]|jgi:cytoskeletal protein RodZ
MPEHDSQPQPNPELASFGEELRREREIRGISLKEIADATKISKRFLEAIERNDHKTLPAPVFTRGFVREYARYLGLSAEDIVNRYNYAAAGDQHVEKTAHLERLVTPTPEPVIVQRPRPKQGIPPPYKRIDRNLIVTVLIIVALAGASWWAYTYKQKRAAAEAQAADATTAPIVTPRPAATPQPAAEPAPDDTVLRLSIEMTGDCWMTLEADGKRVLNDELKEGDRRTFEAKDRFRFQTIGNAGAVTLTINGTQVPPLGDAGEVVKNRVFDREALQQIRSSTAPTSS